jgi:hypothetical protein
MGGKNAILKDSLVYDGLVKDAELFSFSPRSSTNKDPTEWKKKPCPPWLGPDPAPKPSEAPPAPPDPINVTHRKVAVNE